MDYFRIEFKLMKKIKERFLNFIFAKKPLSLPDLFQQYKRTVLPINVVKPNGDHDCGTGFHIGDGYIVTARHVVENMSVVKIDELIINQDRIIFPIDPSVDLALVQTNFNLNHYLNMTTIVGRGHLPKVDRIPLGGHLNDWIGDEFMLSSALIVGYPRVPRSRDQIPVAAFAQIGAIMDEYTSPNPYFIVNTTARGGYSGGPVVSEWGFLLGVVTDCFFEYAQPYETGFMAAISIEPLLALLKDNNIKIENNWNVLYDI